MGRDGSLEFWNLTNNYFTSYLQNCIFFIFGLKQNIYFSLCVEINITLSQIVFLSTKWDPKLGLHA